MKPDAALDLQIQRYRAMTGEQRLDLALELHELACEIARAGIKTQYPATDAAGIERLLNQRVEGAHPAEANMNGHKAGREQRRGHSQFVR